MAAVESADTVIYNGRIYTGSAETAWVEAVAIRDGDIQSIGSSAAIDPYIGDATRLVDLGGAMAMPGINDGHSHPWEGGIKSLYQCQFTFDASPEAIAASLRDCAAKQPDSEWLVGGQWTSDFFLHHDIGSPREWLDAISSDRAILLSDDSMHNGWANSKALALAGITRDTPDPEGGAFAREADGRPNGLLYETAMMRVREHQPAWSMAQRKAGILRALNQGNGFGLTGINDAMVSPDILDAYAALDAEGKLTARVSLSLETPYVYRDTPLVIADYLALRDRHPLTNADARFVKLFLDGVPTSARTALMLDDYLTDEHFTETTRGHLLIDRAVLVEDLVALDKAGFTVKLHAAGDGSVRVALDALQAVREANGDSGLRHELAHAGYIDPEDLPRFAALNVVADLSPYLWYPSPVMESVIGAVGERGRQYFPVKDLLASGADTLMGSDWPAVAQDLNPWPAIEALVTRRSPLAAGEQSLWPEQAISLEQALAIATTGGARALRQAHRTGSITPGKSADLIVLDQNLFDIPVQQISETRVLQTWFQGKLVHAR